MADEQPNHRRSSRKRQPSVKLQDFNMKPTQRSRHKQNSSQKRSSSPQASGIVESSTSQGSHLPPVVTPPICQRRTSDCRGRPSLSFPSVDRRRSTTLVLPRSPLVSSPPRSPVPEHPILSGSCSSSGYSASQIQDAIDEASRTTPVFMNIKDIVFLGESLIVINQNEANRTADQLISEGYKFKAKNSFPVWLHDQHYYALSGFEYKRAYELLGEVWDGKVYVNIIVHRNRKPHLSEIRLAQSLVRGQSEIVERPSCLKMLLQLVTIMNSCGMDVRNLDPEDLGDYLKSRKSTNAFWYVTQTKVSRAAWLNAAKSVHQYELVEKIENVYTNRSHVAKKVKQKDLFAALKCSSSSSKQSMNESIDKLIKHYKHDNPGRFQRQQPQPKNPNERRGGNHSGRPNKKHLERATNNFEKLRDKIQKEIMPRGCDSARREARRGLNSLQRALDIYNGVYANGEHARAELPTPPDTPMSSPSRSPARSSPQRVSENSRSSPSR